MYLYRKTIEPIQHWKKCVYLYLFKTNLVLLFDCKTKIIKNTLICRMGIEIYFYGKQKTQSDKIDIYLLI